MADTHSIRSAAYWTEERIREAAKPYKTIKEFSKGNNRAYKRALKAGIVRDLFESRNREPYTAQDILEASRKYKELGRLAFFKANPSMYGAAKRMGLLEPLFPRLTKRWTRDDAISAAMTCQSKSELQERFYQAYAILRADGTVDELFDNKFKTWTRELVEAEAAKFKTRTEFAKKSGSAYIWSLRNGVIEELIPDVVEGHGDRDCVYIWSIDEHSGIYKVGVTSTTQGLSRIHRVAREAGFFDSMRLVTLKSVGSDVALRVESKLKKIGRKHKFDRQFCGCTEFRHMSPSELSKAVQIVNMH